MNIVEHDEVFDFALVKSRAVKGVLALTSRTFLLQLISVVSRFVLGAFLSPQDIGIFGATTSVMLLVNYFTDFGFGAALVQKKEKIEDHEIATVFTTQFFITLLIFAIFFIGQTYINGVFRLGTLGTQLLLVLIFTVFLSSFKSIPSILLERDLKFDRVIIPQITEVLVFNIILIFLVVRNFGIASYSWAYLVSSLISIPVYFYVRPWKISFGIYKSSLRTIVTGMTFQTKSILGGLKDNLIVIYLLGSRILNLTANGYITWWQGWAFSPFRFIVDSVTKVTFSAYARVQHDANLLTIALEKSLFAVSLALFPIMGGLIVTAYFFINIVTRYQKWEPGLITFYLFCFQAGISALSNVLVNALDATGRVKITVRLMVLWTALVWILMPITIKLIGFNGFALAQLIISFTIVITIAIVKKYIKFNFLGSILKPLIAATTMSVCVLFLNKMLATNLIHLGLNILAGIIIYIACIFIFCKSETLSFIKLVYQRK